MKLTRRQWTAALSASTISAATISATAVAQAQTGPAPADPLQAARDRLKTNADLLAKLPVPMSTEPAFRFHS